MSYFFGGVSAHDKVASNSPPAVMAVSDAKVSAESTALVAACASSAVGFAKAPAAVARAMGRKTSSQKVSKGSKGMVFSLERPFTFRLPQRDNALYKINERYLAGSLTSNVGANAYTSFNFVANSLGDISALQALFDQYRIVKIEVVFFPQSNIVATGATATAGMFHTVVDYDDSGALASEQAALDYQNVVSSSFSDGHVHVFKPHAALAAYQGSFAGYANVESPWIDAAYPSVQHFGIKACVTTASVASVQQVYVSLFTEWRNAR